MFSYSENRPERTATRRTAAMSPTQTEQNPELILSTLDKGLRVLETLGRDGADRGLTLTELGRLLGMHRTTLFRFLATLRARGYVERDPGTDRYRLGLGVLSLASALLDGLDVRRLARPVLVALSDATRELVHLAVFDQGDVVTIERIEGKEPLSLQTEIGARRPAYCTASGKAILACLTAEDVERILAAGMPAVTPRTITSAAAMAAELTEVRARGFAVDDEERILGVRCVAAPVFDHEQRVVGAVSIAAPVVRMPWERVRQLGEEVRIAADAISRRLGYLGAGPSVHGEEPVTLPVPIRP
jgi:IclR family acetate operon transcriptional repressor